MNEELYVIVCDHAEWEDLSIFPDLVDAKCYLLKNYNRKKKKPLGLWIEKFTKMETEQCYVPSYEKILINYENVDFTLLQQYLTNDNTCYFPEEWFVTYTH